MEIMGKSQELAILLNPESIKLNRSKCHDFISFPIIFDGLNVIIIIIITKVPRKKMTEK